MPNDPVTGPGLPFATPTVARLFTSQGRLTQAESIYRTLLDDDPENAQLQQELNALLERIDAEAAKAVVHDRIRIEISEGGLLGCSYRITPAGEARAQLVLNQIGQRALQVLALAVDQGPMVQTLPVKATEGELLVDLPRGTRSVAVAIGVTDHAERFVAIAHVPATDLDEL